MLGSKPEHFFSISVSNADIGIYFSDFVFGFQNRYFFLPISILFLINVIDFVLSFDIFSDFDSFNRYSKSVSNIGCKSYL